MDEKLQTELQEQFNAATESFIGKVRIDPNVIAVIICGSLAYDVVWEKSDIDMTLIVRDQHLSNESYCIVEDGITINVSVVARSSFKRYIESQLGGSFIQSYYSRGKIVYTTDDSLYEYFEEIRKPGCDDIELSIFNIACELVHLYDKCRKWMTVKKDLHYTQYYLLKAAESIARIEVFMSGESPGREVILRALEINPDVIKPFYTNAMSHPMNKEEILQAMASIERYLEEHLDIFKKPALTFLSDQQLKTVTLITRHFHTEGHFIIGIFDYLAEKGVIEKVSQTIRITPKSKLAVEEIGYLYIP